MGYGVRYVEGRGEYCVVFQGEMTKPQARDEARRLNFGLKIRTRREAIYHIETNGTRVEAGPEGLTEILNTVRFGVGYVVGQDADGVLWMTYHTGSDVDDWAVVRYRLETAYPEVLIQALQRQHTVRPHDYPNGRVLDCGHVVFDASAVMTTTRGVSCPDCYDRMSE